MGEGACKASHPVDQRHATRKKKKFFVTNGMNTTSPTNQQCAPAPTFTKKAEQFAALAKRCGAAPKATEMEAYIHEEPLMSEFTDDPVKYWHAKRTGPFARMALDFVSAPGVSMIY